MELSDVEGSGFESLQPMSNAANEEIPNDPILEAAIKTIKQVGESELHQLSLGNSLTRLGKKCNRLEGNLHRLLDATDLVNKARAQGTLDLATFEENTTNSRVTLGIMLQRLGDLQEALKTAPKHAHEIHKLEKTLGQMEEKIEDASHRLASLQAFHVCRSLVEDGVGKMALQRENLDKQVLDYSSAPLNQALSAISLAPLMNKEALPHLHELRRPLFQSMESLETLLPSHGREFRSGLQIDLRETAAQTALSAKRANHHSVGSYQALTEGVYHWNHLRLEYQTYVAALEGGIEDLKKTVAFLQDSRDPTAGILLKEYKRLLRQVERELAETVPMGIWIEQRDAEMVSRLEGANKFIFQNPEHLDLVLSSIFLTISELQEKSKLSKLDILDCQRILIQFEAIRASALFVDQSVVGLIDEAMNTPILSFAKNSNAILGKAVRIAYRGEHKPVTSEKKLRVESLIFRSVLDTCLEHGEEKLEILDTQMDALRDLSQDYSPAALKDVFEYAEALVVLAERCQLGKYSPKFKEEALKEIALALDIVCIQVDEFFDTIYEALNHELSVPLSEKMTQTELEQQRLKYCIAGALYKFFFDNRLKLSDQELPHIRNNVEYLNEKILSVISNFSKLFYSTPDFFDIQEFEVEAVFGNPKVFFDQLSDLPTSTNSARIAAKQKRELVGEACSDTKRKFVGLALLGMMGGSWLSEGVSLSEKAQKLQITAELAARQLRDNVPASVKDDASFIGVMLTDKLRDLRSYTDVEFEKITKKHPEARATLEPFRHSSGPVDSRAVMDAHIMQQAISQSQGSLTIGEWLDTFFNEQNFSAPKPDARPVPEGWKADLHAALQKLDDPATSSELSSLTSNGLSAELGQAIIAQQPERVFEIVKLGVSLDLPLVGTGKTPLEIALEDPNPNAVMVRAFLDNSATYPRSEDSIKGLVAVAEKTVDSEFLEIAVSHGLDLTKRIGHPGVTGLELFLIFGGPTTYDWLLNHPSLVTTPDPATGKTVIQTAIELLNVGFLKQYLAEGFTLKEESKQPLSPLFLAFGQKSARSEQRQEIISMVLSQENLINRPAPLTGETPLFKALACGDAGTADYLIEHGANRDALSKAGETVLHAFAKGGNSSIPLLDGLLQAGVDINARTVSGDTALHYAIQAGNMKAAQLLIERGADFRDINNQGKSALHLLFACRSYLDVEAFDYVRDSIVKGLGGAAGRIPATGESPWHIVLRNNHRDIRIGELLESALPELDLDIADDGGNTLLHAAAEVNSADSWDMIEKLLELGAKPNKENLVGELFLHSAARSPELWEKVSQKSWGDLLAHRNHQGETPEDLLLGASKSLLSALINLGGLLGKLGYEIAKSYIGGSGIKIYLLRSGTLGDLSHAWEMKDNAQLGAFEVALEGSIASWHVPFVHESIIRLREGYSNLMSSHQEELLNSLLDNSIDVQLSLPKTMIADKIIDTHHSNDMKLLSKIKEVGTGRIDTGFFAHSIQIAIHRGYLLVCNRGAATNKPVEVYKINVDLLTEDILYEFGFWFQSDYKADLPKIIEKLQGHRDDTCAALEDLNPLRKYQTVGNCAFESLETAMYGVLALDELLNSGGDPSSNVLAVASSFEVFQGLSNQIRLDALENYLNASEQSSEPWPIAHEVILNLFGKELQELESLEGAQQLADELVKEAVDSQAQLQDTAKQLYNHLYHCRYVMGKSDHAARECLERGFGMPQWREQMEERFGELKGKYQRLYAADPNLLSISNVAQATGFNRIVNS